MVQNINQTKLVVMQLVVIVKHYVHLFDDSQFVLFTCGLNKLCANIVLFKVISKWTRQQTFLHNYEGWKSLGHVHVMTLDVTHVPGHAPRFKTFSDLITKHCLMIHFDQENDCWQTGCDQKYHNPNFDGLNRHRKYQFISENWRRMMQTEHIFIHRALSS